MRVVLAGASTREHTMLQQVVAHMEGEKFDLKWVRSYDEALQEIERGDGAVFLIDQGLGGNRGIELVQAAKTRQHGLPAILLTQSRNATVQFEAMQAGATDCLSSDDLNETLLTSVIRYALELSRAVAKLREEEAELKKLALVASRTDNAVIITDAEGKIEWVNAGFTRITEYQLEEVRGRKPGSFLQGPETDPETVASMRRHLAKGEGFKTTIINYGKSGRKYWLLIEVQPIRDEEGRLINFMAIESDITERMNMVQELRLRERAVSSASEGIIITDFRQPGNPIIYVNDGFVRLTGYSREEALGHNCRYLQGPGTAVDAVQEIRNAIREQRDCQVELLNYRKDGTPFWNRLAISPVRDGKGRLTHFVGVQSDVTARKQAEEKLTAANAEIEAANRRMRSDLEAAAKVQRALLPASLPHVDGVQFAWIFEPCTELAGDSLNIMRADGEHVCLYVLDVSGHGLASALTSVAFSRFLSVRPEASSLLSQQPLEEPTSHLPSPAEIAEFLNRKFPWDAETTQYSTLVYGILHRGTGEFRYVAAGHAGPILVPQQGSVRSFDAPSGPPIGFQLGAYEEHLIQLGPGDRLYLYSDGLTEAMNASDEEFGKERLMSTLEESRKMSLQESLSALERRIERWHGKSEFEDDLSVVALQWQ